jgi:hypothetical protein
MLCCVAFWYGMVWHGVLYAMELYGVGTYTYVQYVFMNTGYDMHMYVDPRALPVDLLWLYTCAIQTYLYACMRAQTQTQHIYGLNIEDHACTRAGNYTTAIFVQASSDLSSIDNFYAGMQVTSRAHAHAIVVYDAMRTRIE